MGKGKAKKAKPTIVHEDSAKAPQPLCTCGHSHEPPRAADGHNVEGWTEEDIRIYNELLTERAKLEREKNELEQKSARHQAERALLHEEAAAFDNFFKVQMTGEYKFTGPSTCCLDFSTDIRKVMDGCHHEVCSRAKSTGVSWMEMDTIKYYQARITSERTPRMKNALRKQRDVELERVKKDDEEELAARNRRSVALDKSNSKNEENLPAMGKPPRDLPPSPLQALLDPKDNAILEAARDNESVVKRIRVRLDRIRQDVHAGRVTAFDARLKLDQANKEMAEAERNNNQFKEMIFTPGHAEDSLHGSSANLSQALSKSLATSNKDTFSQALNVMKGFFSASDPRDVQAAITDLRSVLEINGPMSPVLQKSFQALEDMLAKPNAKGFAVDLTSSDGTTKTCENVIDVLLTLRNNADAATLKATAEELKLDKATLDANERSIAIEDEATDKMLYTLTQKEGRDPKQIYEAIKAIKDEAVKQSFVPPLSDIVLENRMTDLLFNQAGLGLIKESMAGTDEKKLRAMMTSIVIAYSEKDPEKYLPSLDMLARYFASNAGTSKASHIAILKGVLENVKVSMGRFVDKARNNHEAQAKATKQKRPPAVSASSLVPNPLQVSRQPEAGPLGFPGLQDVTTLMGALGLGGNTTAGIQSAQEIINLNRQMTAEDFADALTHDNTNATATDKARIRRDMEQLFATEHGGQDPRLIAGLQEQIMRLANGHGSAKGGAQKGPKKTMKSNNRAKTSKFQEELSSPTPSAIPDDRKSSPPPYMANEGRARSAVKVKHVPVSTPQISGATESADDSTSPSSALSAQEATIKRQLEAMRANLVDLRTPSSSTSVLGKDVLGLRDPFEGITTKLQEQFDGHVAIARSFADTNGWTGLQEWLGKEFHK
ncbi:uncharacterized protein HMPREF1541_05641 [Cyphellophora europaea CBS 101466]|uniref:Uncharacterized protein n=1 Tax=Cyphellophora europaea (strain CBS 101466) TaxID=1220924 RepID=W2RUI6_CYPE1|nr:uncharacterized protein HMPREF1541_05641 [Cyphellophora europaea CBS 101466]ETN39418.1 hypothetical protein HMPREF1541_05641 [Cyphellophora europaea CBS 101466]